MAFGTKRLYLIYFNSFLCIIFVRPNIMGEAIGFIQPVFWLLNLYLLNVQNSKKKNKDVFFLILLYSAIYWVYIIFVNSYADINSNLWAISSSLIAFAIPGYVILKTYEGANIVILQRTFVGIIFLLCAGHFLQLFISFPCTLLNFSNFGSRPYNYTVCLSGSLSLGKRLTGIGGEPGIFAVQIVFAILISFFLRLSIFTKITVLITLVFGLISTYSSTGYVCFTILIIFYFFQKSKKYGLFGLLALIPLYYLYHQFFAQLLSRKASDSPLSITDRGLNISPVEYFHNWSEYFFGNPDRLNKITSINLLTNSYYYGFFVIIIYLLLIFQLYRHGPRRFDYQASLMLISFTTLFSQPPFLNTLWFLLIMLCAYPINLRINS